jgi:cytochrome c peroxidase
MDRGRSLLPRLWLGVWLALLSFHPNAADLTPVEQLGKLLFFDADLSEPAGQACASCHQPAAGWSGPDSAVNVAGAVYEGAVHGRFGNRRPPSAAYAAFSPPLHVDPEEGIFLGGHFWDGRATGWLLGNPAADQAQGPFLNPVEQNQRSPEQVVDKVCASAYGDRFRGVFGRDICTNILSAYNAIAQAIAAYEASQEVNPFSSKYDHHLRDPERYPLSAEEKWGLELFEREDKGNCAACHPSAPGPDGELPLFTDFSYDNLGVPRNPENPWYAMSEQLNPDGEAWVDQGLGGFLKTIPRYADKAQENLGKHKVPTLRNADLRANPGFVKAFMHNGAMKSLKEVVHFYNTRDVKPRCRLVGDPRPGSNCWHAPEIAANLNVEELGDLGLSEAEEDAIVAFMKTLNDGWTPPAQAGGAVGPMADGAPRPRSLRITAARPRSLH